MHCLLLLPDLFWPESHTGDSHRGLELPALERLLAKGRRHDARASPPADASAESWLCERFGVNREGDWPAAPYCLLADGGAPDGHYWLRADPVHLKLEGGRLVLADSGVFQISQHEAEQLAAGLNAHFSGDGLAFCALRPDRWYLRLAQPPALETTALARAAGRSIDALLPRGSDAGAWHARLNEIQMLLHGHAVNAEREAAGKPEINSLWLWGGGAIAQSLRAAFHMVWSADPLTIGLAQAAHVAARELPGSAAELLRASADEGVNLIRLDQLQSPARYGDMPGWRNALAQLERDWFAPLLAALRQGRIGMLSLHATGPTGALSVELVRADLRRFWRRVKPLADYAPA